MAAECNEVLSGDQLCKYKDTIQRFGYFPFWLADKDTRVRYPVVGANTTGSLSLITSALMMEVERASETLDCKSVLIRLIAREDFIKTVIIIVFPVWILVTGYVPALPNLVWPHFCLSSNNMSVSNRAAFLGFFRHSYGHNLCANMSYFSLFLFHILRIRSFVLFRFRINSETLRYFIHLHGRGNRRIGLCLHNIEECWRPSMAQTRIESAV
jgi:hypothetical protein